MIGKYAIFFGMEYCFKFDLMQWTETFKVLFKNSNYKFFKISIKLEKGGDNFFVLSYVVLKYSFVNRTFKNKIFKISKKKSAYPKEINFDGCFSSVNKKCK